MKKRPRTFILAGFLLVVVVVLSVSLFNFSRQPVSQQLMLESRASIIASLNQEGTASSTSPTATSPVAAADSAGAEVCGQSGAYTFFIIGSDASDMRGRPGSDLIRLARVDFSGRKVSIFSLPRDLWVDVHSLGFKNPIITDTALGMSYYEAYKRSVQAEESDQMTDGAQASAQIILDNFGVTTDHYIVINLSQLPTLIDAIGGLPIEIPERTTDPWIGMVIEAGPQTLTGVQVMAYARAIPDSDFTRIQRNNLILRALRQKFLHPYVWMKLPILYDQFNEMFITDLSPQQIFSLFCLLRQVPREEILMEQVRPEWTSPGPSDSFLWDKDKVFSALKQLELIQ